MKYILLVVALLEACDVTNNDRHLGCHLGFYQELEIRLKPRQVVIFCALHKKVHINKHFAILATTFTFIVERSWKNMYFNPKMA